ncbi:MAG: RNase adapter RapZ [Betaproteobacteria bacterium]|nr:MAG: RNase adapter RapZ [Betaproteobacteria bacterium]
MQLVLISGLSGSGKSVALNVLEDSGYYCVDNLPVALVVPLLESLAGSGHERVALSMDARSGQSVRELPQTVAALKQQGVDVRLLFLDAKDETLIKRFSETRRLHPLSQGELTLAESIARERELLDDVGELGHHIDTSELSPNTLRSWIKNLVEVDRSRLTLMFESFGFKQGLPLDADFVFDVRCLPNPFYEPQLRELTGLDRPVAAFLEKDEATRNMYRDIHAFIANWLPAFERENRSYLTVAVGCTGGQHRSVYFAERLGAAFRANNQVMIRHRQIR